MRLPESRSAPLALLQPPPSPLVFARQLPRRLVNPRLLHVAVAPCAHACARNIILFWRHIATHWHGPRSWQREPGPGLSQLLIAGGTLPAKVHSFRTLDALRMLPFLHDGVHVYAFIEDCHSSSGVFQMGPCRFHVFLSNNGRGLGRNRFGHVCCRTS